LVLTSVPFLNYGRLPDGFIDNRMLFFNDFLVELLVGANAHGELLLINGAAVLLESTDEAAVVIEHLTVEAQQVVVLVHCVFKLHSQRTELIRLDLPFRVRLFNQCLEGKVVLKECVYEEWIGL
jgi:hypothetical protein